MAINNLVITIGGRCAGAGPPRAPLPPPADSPRSRRPPPPPAVGLSAVALLMKSDVRHSSAMLRRNMRTIRSWLEEQGQAAG
jgi:hypothetical protein